MGRNEIKLRRSKMSEGHIARHRNYGLLMKRHHRDLRVKRVTIALIYLLIIIAVTVLYLVVKKEEQHRKIHATPPATTMMSPASSGLELSTALDIRLQVHTIVSVAPSK